MRRRARQIVASSSALLALCGCPRSDPAHDWEEQAGALQVDLHRAFITTRALGRFGELGMFEQELAGTPCEVPLSETNHVCKVMLLGRGKARMQVADAELDKGSQLQHDALISVEYETDCANARFDFKTVDNVLPRGATQGGVTVWENKLLRVTHRRVPGAPGESCTLTVEAAPALIARVKQFPAHP